MLFISLLDRIFFRYTYKNYFSLLQVIYNLKSCKIAPIEWESDNLDRYALDQGPANYSFQPNISTTLVFCGWFYQNIPCLFIYALAMVSFWLLKWSWVVRTETVWPTKVKCFLFQSLTERTVLQIMHNIPQRYMFLTMKQIGVFI